MKRIVIFLLIALLLPIMISAQASATGQTVRTQAGPEIALDARARQQLGEIIAHLLESMYVLPDEGKQLAAKIRAKFAGGTYDGATSAIQLADLLTRDLRELGKDGHLYLRYSADLAKSPVLTVEGWEQRQRQVRTPTQGSGVNGNVPRPSDAEAREAENLRRDNYHFRDVRRLDGNVGYLDLGGFASGTAARDTAAGAMSQLATADAVIIDLRRCPGGSPEMVNFLASYFFGPEPRVLMTRYFRPTGETIQSTTVSDIPGKRMPDTDLYILTSSGSASACESFAYTLQQYGRAKVVGGRTAGAGYNNALIPIGYGLTLSVSIGRPIHPRSGKGWQGVGVQPDIEVPAGTALEAAHKEALKNLIAKTTDEGRKRDLTRVMEASQAKPGAVAASSVALQDYIGRYGNKEITVKDDGLFYQRIGGGGGALRALSKDKFALNTDAEIGFVRDAKGTVTEMLIEWRDRPQERLSREPLKN